MSGIGGWVAHGEARDRAEAFALIGGTTDAVWSDGPVVLACRPRRGTAGGLAVADDRVVAFEGRIVDRPALAALLERRGQPTSGKSDAELVLLGWRALGPAILDRIDGGFALAMWDRGESKMLLARDRMGARNLAWASGRQGVVFASDPRRVASAIGAEIDPGKIVELLLQGHVSPPCTVHHGVSRLEPGAVLTVDPEGRARSKVVFAPSFIPRAGADRAALEARLELVVQASLHRQPRAALLLDGTPGSIALARHVDRGVDTVSVAFDGELDAAVAHAEALGRRHHPISLSPDTMPSMRDLVAEQGGPFATPLPIVLGAVKRELGSSVDALLLPAGAHALAGLPAAARAAIEDVLPPAIASALGRGSERLADVSLWGVRARLESVARAARASEVPIARRVLGATAVFSPEQLASALRPEWEGALFEAARWSDGVVRRASAASPLGVALAHGVRSRLEEITLPAIDASLAAEELEPLLPFLDPRWVELATGLDDATRAAALSAMVPAGLSAEPDAEDARLARWMSGPLERGWRDIVFGECTALRRYFDPIRMRALLVTTPDRNPARWKQALMLWSLEAWLAG